MNVILDISIRVKGKHLHTIMRREIKTDLFPFPGIQIEDPAWKDPKQALSITCNFTEGYYHILFEAIELDNEEMCNREVEMYRLHGWKKPSE